MCDQFGWRIAYCSVIIAPRSEICNYGVKNMGKSRNGKPGPKPLKEIYGREIVSFKYKCSTRQRDWIYAVAERHDVSASEVMRRFMGYCMMLDNPKAFKFFDLDVVVMDATARLIKSSFRKFITEAMNNPELDMMAIEYWDKMEEN